jgi:ATP-dependent RNA helicase DeaD
VSVQHIVFRRFSVRQRAHRFGSIPFMLTSRSGRLKVANLEAVVLDEFDALLEYRPHRDPTAAIMANLRKRHGDSLQSVLCSATASNLIGSRKVDSLLRKGHVKAMADQNDKLVTSAGATPATARVSLTVMHGVIHVPHRRLALETLRKVLHTEPIPQQVLVFADNARRVDIVVEKLGRMGIIAAPLHGGFGSEKADRAEVSRGLREGYIGIVVATELAARGLDAPLLTHVINLDLPTDASHYAHRAGRCGRGGRPGVVVNLTTNPKERNVPHRIAGSLGIAMHTVEARSGKLAVVEPNISVDGRDEP